MDNNEIGENAVDRLFEGIRTAQQLTLDVVERAGKTFSELIPRIDVPLPFELPRPREVAERAFRFTERLAENNKEFTLKLLDALYPAPAHSRKTK